MKREGKGDGDTRGQEGGLVRSRRKKSNGSR